MASIRSCRRHHNLIKCMKRRIVYQQNNINTQNSHKKHKSFKEWNRNISFLLATKTKVLRSHSSVRVVVGDGAVCCWDELKWQKHPKTISYITNWKISFLENKHCAEDKSQKYYNKNSSSYNFCVQQTICYYIMCVYTMEHIDLPDGGILDVE